MTDGVSTVARLRSATAADHDAVDAGFGRYNLTDTDDYRAFLIAHARALPAIETWLAAIPGLSAVRSRGAALAEDLAALGEDMPAPMTFDVPASAAAGWGAMYVVEGSRLGGIMLSRSVPDGMPSAYLGAKHLSGEWRALLTAIDEEPADDAWVEEAIVGAKAAFDLYRRAPA
ncbi:biliverdin-producing heme oxygenase [Sphingomonas sp. CFBP 13603]|uniref:biliverdin-producing heme oxygenase n=1 Tax=Sphingomonas sp. CFBP 13603 TaxID=2774040 RepID=UPI001866E85B|nr:biliverdin-producing heme oxygenase [Sphingomonas sp. CFBP 13603]MBE2994092.1 biliverdin-producing heme oxygenase [Sphingomonas sp. CFBP 13603]